MKTCSRPTFPYPHNKPKQTTFKPVVFFGFKQTSLSGKKFYNSHISIIVDNLEFHISRAEVAYRSGETALALSEGKLALELCDKEAKTVALKIFIAKCLSKLGNTKESNTVYRELINDKIYLAPVISGLLYNHFSRGENNEEQLTHFEKIRNSIRLMKIFLP